MKRNLIAVSSVLACSLLCATVGKTALQTAKAEDTWYTVSLTNASVVTANADDMRVLGDGTVQVKAGAAVDAKADYIFAQDLRYSNNGATWSIKSGGSAVSYTPYYTHAEFTMPEGDVTIEMNSCKDYEYRELQLTDATVTSGNSIEVTHIDYSTYDASNIGWFGAKDVDFTLAGLTTLTLTWDTVWETFGRTHAATTSQYGFFVSPDYANFDIYNKGYNAVVAANGQTATDFGAWNQGAYNGKGAIILDVATGKVTGRHGNIYNFGSYANAGNNGYTSYSQALTESSMFGVFFANAYTMSQFVNLRAVDNLGNEYEIYHSKDELGNYPVEKITGVNKGAEVTVTADEKAGFTLTGWDIKTTENEAITDKLVSGNSVSFTMPTAVGVGIVATPIYEAAGCAHSFTVEKVTDEALKSAATCTSGAVYYKSCECGEISESDEDTFVSGSPIAHTFSLETVKDEALRSAATCTSAAVYYKSCECGEISENAEDTFVNGTALSHDFTGDWQKDAEGHWHICENEGCDEIEEKSAHEFGEWTETQAPTATENGKKERSCSCGHVEEEVVPATGTTSNSTSESTEKEPDKDSGCGSTIAGSTIGMVAFVSVATLLLRKKERQ